MLSLENYKKALLALQQGLARPPSNDLERDGVIQRFEFTFEAMWKADLGRRYLALVLGQSGDPQAVPLLVESLEDPDSEMRIYALLALGELGEPSAAGALAASLGDDDPGIRKTAAYALGELGLTGEAGRSSVAAIADASGIVDLMKELSELSEAASPAYADALNARAYARALGEIDLRER